MRSRLFLPGRRRAAVLATLSAVASIGIACSGEGSGGSGTPDPNEPRVHGLTAAERDAPVATIGDRTITAGEFAEIVASKGPFLSVRYNAPERRRELLDQLVRFELLANEADARGFDELPEVVRSRKQLVVRRFLKREFEDAFSPDDVTDEEVRAYYDAHIDEFNKPAQIRVSQIVVATEAEARRILRQVLAAPTDVRLFRALAEAHDTDPTTMDRFGDIGFFSRPEERQAGEPEVPPEVANAAFAIEAIGGVASDVVHTSRGWHILKLTGRRAPLHRTVEEAARPIRHRLYRERREHAVADLLTRLRGEADVYEDLALLDTIHIDVPEGTGTLPMLAPPPGPLDAVLPRAPGSATPGSATPSSATPAGPTAAGAGVPSTPGPAPVAPSTSATAPAPGATE